MGPHRKTLDNFLLELQRAVERDCRAVNASEELLLRAKALAQQTRERVRQALERDRGRTAWPPVP